MNYKGSTGTGKGIVKNLPHFMVYAQTASKAM